MFCCLSVLCVYPRTIMNCFQCNRFFISVFYACLLCVCVFCLLCVFVWSFCMCFLCVCRFACLRIYAFVCVIEFLVACIFAWGHCVIMSTCLWLLCSLLENVKMYNCLNECEHVHIIPILCFLICNISAQLCSTSYLLSLVIVMIKETMQSIN